MFNYDKLKKVLKDKLYHEQYNNVRKILITYLENGNDCKELLECLKDASIEIRLNQTIKSMDTESEMLKQIFNYALEKDYLKPGDDLNYVQNYVEEYRKL